MKKLIFILLFASIASAQQKPIWSTVARGTSLPVNIPRAGYLFFRTADSTLHVSTGLTWRTIGSGGAGDFHNGGDIAGANRTLGNNDAFAMLFETNNIERMRINGSDGSIGIGLGAVTPQALLHLNENASYSPGIKFTSSTAGTGATDGALIYHDPTQEFFIKNYENAAMQFYVNNLHRLSLQPTGTAATFTPDSTLSVRGGGRFMGGLKLGSWLAKPDFLEFYGQGLQATAANGAEDSTVFYMPMKLFAVDDTATFDFSTSKRFASLDSIVIIGTSPTAASSVVFNVAVRQIQRTGAYTGAFNTAASATISTSTANTQVTWSLSSFGSLTTSVRSTIICKVYRTTGGTGAKIRIERVLIYGVGLR